MKRYLDDRIRQDLARKMVVLTGPRQVGKTTLSQQLLAEHPGGQDSAEPAMAEASAEARAKAPTGAGAEALAGPDAAQPPAAGAEARRKPAADPAPDEPQLPLGGPVSRHEP